MRLKFVCLNLWMGGNLFDNIVDFINKEKPDILAFQEATSSVDVASGYHTIEELNNILKYPFVDFAPTFFHTRPDMPNGQFGNAIFSKFPIIARDVTFYDVPYDSDYSESRDFSFTPRNLQHLRLDLEGKELNVFNTQGVWGFDGSDNARRLLMSDIIRKKYAGKQNVILCGDFNTKEETKAMTNFEKELKNVFKGELTTSFNMRHKPADSGFASAVVDMIYVSQEMKVLEHYSTDADLTDHVPLVAVLEI